jgi:hypothetical protein
LTSPAGQEKQKMSSDSVLSKAETFVTSTLAQLLEYQKQAENLSIVDLTKHVKLSHVAAAVALVVASSIYKSLSYPNKLAHIAHVPARKNIRSFIKGETNVDRAKQLFIPLCLETKGLVAKYAQFGWEVAVISPESARTVFRNPGRKDFIPCCVKYLIIRLTIQASARYFSEDGELELVRSPNPFYPLLRQYQPSSC